MCTRPDFEPNTDEPAETVIGNTALSDGRLKLRFKHTSHIVTRVKSCPLNSNEIHAPNIPDRLMAKDGLMGG